MLAALTWLSELRNYKGTPPKDKGDIYSWEQENLLRPCTRLKTVEPFPSLLKKQGVSRQEGRENLQSSLCVLSHSSHLFFKISWKGMSHLNIAGNQLEVEGKNYFGQSFSLECL